MTILQLHLSNFPLLLNPILPILSGYSNPKLFASSSQDLTVFSLDIPWSGSSHFDHCAMLIVFALPMSQPAQSTLLNLKHHLKLNCVWCEEQFPRLGRIQQAVKCPISYVKESRKVIQDPHRDADQHQN